MGGRELRNELLEALNEVYASDFVGKDWYDCKYRGNITVDCNMQLVTDILALYVYTKIDPEHDKHAKYYGEILGLEIRNMIWMVHSGGSTASYAAEKICNILKVDYDAKD